MEMELLRTFLELNHSRHFGRAAESLFITQAAVSSRLKLLEQQLGSRLFDRNRREMRLTPEGSRLLGHADRILAAWDAACQDVAPSEGQQLVIGGSLRLWDVLLQNWLHMIRQTYADMAIIAESQTPDTLIKKLIDGSMDVAIVLEPAQLETLHIQPVAKIDLILVSSEQGRHCSNALQNGYVYIDWGLSFALDHKRSFPDAPESRTRVSSAKMAFEYLQVQGGSAFLPKTMVESHMQSGNLFPVEGAPEFTRQAYATFPVRSSKLALIQQCLELIH